jgi:hypothetical protein
MSTPGSASAIPRRRDGLGRLRRAGYREVYRNSRYDNMLAGIVRYLLALRDSTG